MSLWSKVSKFLFVVCLFFSHEERTLNFPQCPIGIFGETPVAFLLWPTDGTCSSKLLGLQRPPGPEPHPVPTVALFPPQGRAEAE